MEYFSMIKSKERRKKKNVESRIVTLLSVARARVCKSHVLAALALDFRAKTWMDGRPNETTETMRRRRELSHKPKEEIQFSANRGIVANGCSSQPEIIKRPQPKKSASVCRPTKPLSRILIQKGKKKLFFVGLQIA